MAGYGVYARALDRDQLYWSRTSTGADLGSTPRAGHYALVNLCDDLIFAILGPRTGAVTVVRLEAELNVPLVVESRHLGNGSPWWFVWPTLP